LGTRSADFLAWLFSFTGAANTDFLRPFLLILEKPNVTEPNLDGEIRNGRHHMAVRVYYEDTDFSGVTYHANYLRFMERGRTNYLRLLGTNHRDLFEETQNETSGFAFVVRSMAIDFFKPSFMDDVLEIVTSPLEVKGASITLLQQCNRSGSILVKARVRVAVVSGGKAQRIPKALRLAMEAVHLPSEITGRL
jgi:acyl-CoA thioester hydrolase